MGSPRQSPRQENHEDDHLIDTRNHCSTVCTAIHDTVDIDSADHVSDAVGFATLAASWPMARLVEIWNNLPGARPVTRFTDRKTAIGRIWKALEGLEEALPEATSTPEAMPTGALERAQSPLSASRERPAAKEGSRGKAARQSREKLASADPKTTKEHTQNNASKKAQIVALLGRPEGATLHELMAATRWQAHSVRGFLSGTLGKKMGLFVVSGKAENGERTYSIEA